MLSPERFLTVPCPGYDGIRLAVAPQLRLGRLLAAQMTGGDEVAVHIATEGPLGRAARRWCRRHAVPFTTAYHTRFPQYLRAMYRVPERWTYAVMRRFHNGASVVMAPTATVAAELGDQGVGNVALWTRGVDTELFRPTAPLPLTLLQPVFLYVGRVSVEKNVADFLAADLPGSKIVAGEGPALPTLKRRFPEAHFLGVLGQAELARLYSTASVFVFPLPAPATTSTGPSPWVTASRWRGLSSLIQSTVSIVDSLQGQQTPGILHHHCPDLLCRYAVEPHQRHDLSQQVGVAASSVAHQPHLHAHIVREQHLLDVAARNQGDDLLHPPQVVRRVRQRAFGNCHPGRIVSFEAEEVVFDEASRLQ